MASASAAVSMALPLSYSSTHKKLNHPSSFEVFLRPLLLPQSKRKVVKKSHSKSNLEIHSSLKEKAVTGLTAATITASMVIPDVAQAAGNDFSPSLQNILLSIVAGGVVLGAIFGAVIGVSNFDPVKRA